MGSEFKAFADHKFSYYLDNCRHMIKREVESEPEDFILNTNETDYINHIVEKFEIENLEIDSENIFVVDIEKDIPSENFPNNFIVSRGKSYKKSVIKYFLPFKGNKELLKFQASVFDLSSSIISIEDNNICFEIINFDDNVQIIKNEATRRIENLKTSINFLNKDIEKFNSDLNSLVLGIFHNRKEAFLRKNNVLASLGVPILKRKEISKTFSVPSLSVRKQIFVKPQVTEKGFKPEPALDDLIYQDILKTIYEVGKAFERMPSTYNKKSEEDIRDHFLLFLEPRYEGSATGETFNKTGKTDILIRYQNNNVFIAECKFWSGQRKFLDTISQLLSYLVWRDSKASVIIFVRNKDFTLTLEKIKEICPNHPNYLSFVNEKHETWLNYRFHLNGDKNRDVKIGILVFHFP